MPTRANLGVILVILVQAILISLLATGGGGAIQTTQDVVDGTTEPAPPAGQTYIGTKNCASCHFEQYGVWRQDKHAKSFENLPDKYKTDASCLECHTTGFGEETGFKTAADAHLAGTSCEACHGPGSKHQEICQEFATVKQLSTEQEALARDSIYLLMPHNACIRCHTSKAHKEHPEFDK